MRSKRRGILLTLLLLALLFVSAWFLFAPCEPSYHGRKLSEWLDDYNQAGSIDKAQPVFEAIRAMGTNALPFLLANLKHQDSPLKMKFYALAANQHLLKPPLYGADPYRFTSIMALSALGSNAAPIFPELLEISLQTNTYWFGMYSLLGIGPSAIPTLAKACHSANVEVRTSAILMICIMKNTGSPHFSWGYRNAPVNGKPMLILGWAVSDREQREMVNLLEDSDPAVRKASAETIARFCAPVYAAVDKSAIPPLTQLFKNDADPDVRRAAGETLKKIEAVAAANAGVK
jgi:HEAT repeat protein